MLGMASDIRTAKLYLALQTHLQTEKTLTYRRTIQYRVCSPHFDHSFWSFLLPLWTNALCRSRETRKLAGCLQALLPSYPRLTLTPLKRCTTTLHKTSLWWACCRYHSDVITLTRYSVWRSYISPNSLATSWWWPNASKHQRINVL